VTVSDSNNNDVFGMVAVGCGVLSFLGWMVCAFGSILGLGLIGLGMTTVFGIMAVIFGLVGHMNTAEDGSSAMSLIGAAMGVINLLLIAGYCAFTFGLLALIMAFFGLAIIAEAA
jgi:hypothetical protein